MSADAYGNAPRHIEPMHNMNNYMEPGSNTMNKNLIKAINAGRVDEVARLIDTGADVNTVDSYGAPALWLAAAYTNLPIVELLLASPLIDVNKEWVDSPLLIAMHRESRSIVERLLRVPGIEVNKTSALIAALSRGLIPIVDLVLAHPDVDVNQETEGGITALYVAVKSKRPQNVEKLLRNSRIDVNKPSKIGNLDPPTLETPLMLAVLKAHNSNRNGTRILDALLAHPDIDVNYTNPDGDSALSYTERITADMVPIVTSKLILHGATDPTFAAHRRMTTAAQPTQLVLGTLANAAWRRRRAAVTAYAAAHANADANADAHAAAHAAEHANERRRTRRRHRVKKTRRSRQ